MQSEINANNLLDLFDSKNFRLLNEEMSFEEYLQKLEKNPKLVRTAYQRMYDMIVSEGFKTINVRGRDYISYNFFNRVCPIYGLYETLHQLVQSLKGAAAGYGVERRVLLLHGPVGSSKSTICKRLKIGLEEYTGSDAGAYYTYKWVNLPTTGKDALYTHDSDLCPMHDHPLKLIPENLRSVYVKHLDDKMHQDMDLKTSADHYHLKCDGELNPRCKLFMKALLSKYDGDFKQVIKNHIRVVRIQFSEADRIGIGTFQPKDEKNQDSTELTGDVNYAKLAQFGSDSSPLAFEYDGEFCVSQGGMLEFIEVLKLAKEFLYDLLGASQERQIKPKKQAQISLDTVLICHTNSPEYEKLRQDQTMEALRDRTVKIDVPYLLEVSHEINVLLKDYGNGKVRKHIAPHTLELAALWAILTRLYSPKKGDISLVDKAKLYDGEVKEGYNEASVRELRAEYPEEGMKRGISVRYVQDKISNCLSNPLKNYVNFFMVLDELKSGLEHNSLVNDQTQKEHYKQCCEYVRKEFDRIIRQEVRRAIVGNEEVIETLFHNYIENVNAWCKESKIIDRYTGEERHPNEKLMREIEEGINIPETKKGDYRQSVMAFIADGHLNNKKINHKSNQKLYKALENKLFRDTKDYIKLSALNNPSAAQIDKETRDKIDAIKTRMVNEYGYTEESANDVLEYAGSIFNRGDMDE